MPIVARAAAIAQSFVVGRVNLAVRRPNRCLWKKYDSPSKSTCNSRPNTANKVLATINGAANAEHPF